VSVLLRAGSRGAGAALDEEEAALPAADADTGHGADSLAAALTAQASAQAALCASSNSVPA
jgi:hypothetical protein